MVKRRRMTAKQLKYFGPRRTRRVKKPRVVYMARRRRSYGRRFVSRARRSAGGMGGISMLAPVAGGAIDVVAQKYIPVFGVGSTAAGFLLKDQVTMKIGLNKIGESLGAMFAGGGGNGGNGGWL